MTIKWEDGGQVVWLWASRLTAISHCFLPQLSGTQVEEKAVTTPPCLESKDQGWSPTSHSFQHSGDKAVPMTRRYTWVSNFWKPVEHLSAFLVPKEGPGAHEFRCSFEQDLLFACAFTVWLCISIVFLSFLRVTVSFCFPSAERRWSWGGLSDAEGSLEKEKFCYRLHMWGRS